MRRFLALLAPAVALLLSSCAAAPVADKKPEIPFYLKPTSFAALPGWQADSVSAALPALQKSCARIATKKADISFGPVPFAGTYADWQTACAALPADMSDAAARGYFEAAFTPYEVWGDDGRDGLFTGYYEPLLHGSATKHAPYLTPLYGRPDDLISVNLGDFKDELKGQTVVGRVKGQNLVPYFTRAQIDNGAIDKSAQQIVWVSSPVDAFFLHIQGSGFVEMDDGTTLHVGFAAQNGHAYYAIGQELIKRGALDSKTVSMQGIRDWLEKNPDEAPKVMDLNESYVFFRTLTGDGPLGAEGVALTPQRSLAIDRKKFPYGAPFFIDAAPPEGGTPKLQQLMIAQDTGGAIKGAVRGDFFWGAGDAATHNAGVMKSPGQSYILLPKAVKVPEMYNLKSRKIAADYNP